MWYCVTDVATITVLISLIAFEISFLFGLLVRKFIRIVC
jgi:hypothetical protein